MDKIGIIGILVFVFVAELPCMLRTMALEMNDGSLWSVIWGTVFGNAVALVVGLALAHMMLKGFTYVNFGFVNYLSGLMFILLGLWVIFHGHSH